MTTYTCTRCGHTGYYRTPPAMCPLCMGDMEPKASQGKREKRRRE